MSLELKINNRTARIEILTRNGSHYRVLIDNKEYELDIEKVEHNAYSILHQGKSINMEMIEGKSANHYQVNTYNRYYEIDIIDAATRYRHHFNGQITSLDRFITSPMPGKVVKILVEEGEAVARNQTLIVVSAMKMDSEYKSPFDGVIKTVLVKEGQAVDALQHLIEIENMGKEEGKSKKGKG
ncbi:acetyl-CoA carboxylase biotin carboxyl carrier protein subunit [Marinilabiliaceae bacterium JC017]|nr:acetyl-CoA carboxylase biotin carboxyl carrier protein subunit [Marinilabiliaceae bacterium JC017]